MKLTDIVTVRHSNSLQDTCLWTTRQSRLHNDTRNVAVDHVQVWKSEAQIFSCGPDSTPKVFRGFPQSSQTMLALYFKLHDCLLLLSRFGFTIEKKTPHPSFHY